MGVLYRIKDWDLHYEKAQTRTVQRTSWVPTSLKHDGKSFRRIMALKNGLMIFGAWNLILQVAAKCPTRGTLADADGTPLTAEDLALKTGAPESQLATSLEVLCRLDIGWLVATHCDASQSSTPPVATIGQVLQVGQDSTGQDRGAASRFTKPTLEEVAAYCKERGNDVDPQRWVAFYTSNGWKVNGGRAPMKDWQAAIRYWEGNSYGAGKAKPKVPTLGGK